MKKNSKKGFTFVEMVAVVAILGILAAVSVPSVLKMAEVLNHSADEASAKLYEGALKTYVSRKVQERTFLYLCDYQGSSEEEQQGDPLTSGGKQQVANTISKAMDGGDLSFACKSKDYLFYYNPQSLQVLALASEDNVPQGFLPLADKRGRPLTGEASGPLLN